MGRGALLYAIGLVTGALVMSATHSVWHRTEHTPKENPVKPDSRQSAKQSGDRTPDETLTENKDSGGSDDTLASVASEPTGSPAAPAETANAITPADSAGATQVSHAQIPAPYAEMIEPKPLPKTLAPPELFERFAGDVRDDTWAYAMELGINQYIARRGSELESAFEFVECRSRYCTIAGVVYEGGQATVNEMLSEMTQSGWWQTYGGASTVGRTTDTVYRFVTIFPRAREDTDRDPSQGQPEDKGAESSVQAVDT